MKFFIDELLKYDAIGFDLDGTIYDEYEFIIQAYMSVANVISNETKIDKAIVNDVLCKKWLQFGSSANIFQLTAKQILGIDFEKQLIKDCVKAYRNCEIRLNLPARSRMVFSELKNKGKCMFLVTDGNSELQRKKIEALGISEWFGEGRIAISGDYGKECQKPSPYMLSKIAIENDENKKMIYIGDRWMDRQFAENTDMKFIEVRVMQPV